MENNESQRKYRRSYILLLIILWVMILAAIFIFRESPIGVQIGFLGFLLGPFIGIGLYKAGLFELLGIKLRDLISPKLPDNRYK